MEKEPKDTLPLAKTKWLELGFMRLETFVKNANIDKDIDYNLKLGRDKNHPHIKGQLSSLLQCDGIVRAHDTHSIYEGQFQNGKPHGYGRKIYFNGESHEGYWREGAWIGTKWEKKQKRRLETSPSPE